MATPPSATPDTSLPDANAAGEPTVAELKSQANDAFKNNKFLEAQRLYTVAIDQARNEVLQTSTPSTTPSSSPPTSPPSAASDVPQAQEDSQPSEMSKTLAVLLGNRANTAIKLEQYASAIDDANSALLYNSSYVKAYYRKGTAYFAQSNYKMARKNYVILTKRLPNDRDARNKLHECDKRLREIAFSRAIEEDGTISPSSSSSSLSSAGMGSSNSMVPMSGGVAHMCNTINLDKFPVNDDYKGPSYDPAEGVTLDFITKMIDTFRSQKLIHIQYALRIVLESRAIMTALPNIVDLAVYKGQHITVCGDVHGQFYDLVDCIFKENGLPSRTNPYIFNGDFVDRGSFSVEVILTLLAFKCYDPQCIHLIRGNHESLNMNKIYGFEGECAAKYSDLFFKCFSEFFQSLPLAYTLHGKPYDQPKEDAQKENKSDEATDSMDVVKPEKEEQGATKQENGTANGTAEHLEEKSEGGSKAANGDVDGDTSMSDDGSKSESKVDDEEAKSSSTQQNGTSEASADKSVFEKKDGRRVFIVHGGLFSRDGVTLADIQELDRNTEPETGLMAEMLWSDPQDEPGWGPSKRGIGVAFGPDVTHRFLDANNLDLVVRSHEMKERGYEVGADGRLITIFSAPNYCDSMGNEGAYINFTHEMLPEFHRFKAVPHPPVKPMQYASNFFFG